MKNQLVFYHWEMFYFNSLEILKLNLNFCCSFMFVFMLFMFVFSNEKKKEFDFLFIFPKQNVFAIQELHLQKHEVVLKHHFVYEHSKHLEQVPMFVCFMFMFVWFAFIMFVRFFYFFCGEMNCGVRNICYIPMSICIHTKKKKKNKKEWMEKITNMNNRKKKHTL